LEGSCSLLSFRLCHALVSFPNNSVQAADQF
jgi:hypothetical protein